MMKFALPIALVMLTTVGTSRADTPSVAVDIAPVHSLVSHVMGSLGEPALVVSHGASPHGYSLRPSEAQSLQEAEIVFWVSEGLTPWLPDTIGTLSSNAAQVELIEVDGVTELDYMEGALFETHEHGDEHHGDDEHTADDHGDDEHHDDEHAKNDHGDDEHASHGDNEHAHGEHDPHAWLDPSNAAIWLETIAAELSKADPDNAEIYMANAAAGKAELEQLQSDVNEILAPVRERSFIVFHDAYQYFENAFDFPSAGAISIGDASKPSPARIQEIHDRVAQANVSCVLSEPQFNPDLVNTVLDGTDAHTSVVDPLGSQLDIGSNLYPQLLRDLATTLAGCV